MRVIYMFTILDISCPLIPPTLDVSILDQFCIWLSTDPQEYIRYPFHNVLKPFFMGH